MNRLLTTIVVLAALCAALAPAHAAEKPAVVPSVIAASNYETFKGAPFFLLSDTAFGSTETARVRLEVPGRDHARSSLEQYGGVDVMVYKVPQPLEFLKKQRNLHRVDVTGNYQGEGLVNALSQLWDHWWKKSRLAFRRLFSSQARQAVTEAQPKLATSPAIHRPTEFRAQRQYQPLKGFELVDQFRYPLWQAKLIEPPNEVKLAGSSSEFADAGAGNIFIPIGKRAPGLYLVEALVGEHRATTLVFVSNTMAITKVSANQMLVWTARRDNGAAVANVAVNWTDGSGVLQSGTTAANGVLSLERGSPEHTYVMGEDADGGVFVSENFYYDSEIYNTKIYAVTDRPLYRPGDDVNVKFMAREFISARVSQPAAAAPLTLSVLDPAGTPILTQNLQLSPETGADTRFKLPALASAGGYELRFHYRDTQYSAAFRVADYVKPHFEMNIVPGKTDFKTGDKVKGRIELRYPDGKPVKEAALSLTLRAQQNTVVEGELRYGGQFPVDLKTQTLTTDSSGNANFELPEAKEPSRYILTVLASDGAAYRVKSTRELMIERSASLYRLAAPRRFSKPGEAVRFAISGEGPATARPIKWEMVQLEKQVKTQGDLTLNATAWDVNFATPGSYQLSLRDAQGNLVGATSHWVTGDGLKGTPGSIEIVFDRERYRAGETAEALLTFADPVDQALLTLERDKVESVSLLKGGADWVSAVRVAPNQYRVRVPVKADYGPTITFSVAYTRQGDFVFQNAGLQIIEPRIALTFKTDKEVYQPGEKVTLEVMAQLEGQPISTMVALSVVDEMIYVLQSEIAPEISDFFYHPRRNNVRTTASLSFISYDLAAGRATGAPARSNYNERAVKVLERPRRDNTDTALWMPNVTTDAAGRARVSFTMPDSLTRWRITGRALDAQGRVGQRSGYLRSDKSFYAKWTAPNWLRAGDMPQASVALFNQTAGEQELEVLLTGGGLARTQKIKAQRGVNYVHFDVPAGGGAMRLELKQAGKLVDSLDTSVQVVPQQWISARSLNVPVSAPVTALALPPDARNIRVALTQGSASHFARIADDLIDYPFGGVEHTASRLIPLSLAAQSVGPEPAVLRERLMTRLQSERLRLVSMAGPDAIFGWWGNATAGSAFMTAYAYYADWHAARSLKIELPAEHWENLLTVYGTLGIKEPLLQRALTLWMAHEMGLPVKTLAAGLAGDVAKANQLAGKPALFVRTDSAMMGTDDATTRALTAVLLSVVSANSGLEQSESTQTQTAAAIALLGAHQSPFVQSLLMLSGQVPVGAADNLLASVSADMPSIDRALALLWVQKKLGGPPPFKSVPVSLSSTWFKNTTATGQTSWVWQGAAVPTQLLMTEAAPAGSVAVVQYDSGAPETHKLAVRVERRVLLLSPAKEGFDATPVKNGEALRTDALYMDEITLTPAAGARHRYGVLEVPLPPGGSVEAGTWGIKIDGEKDAFERARHDTRRDGYVVAVEPLAAALKVRHLVRFAQKGSYTLPPARFYRAYQPDQKAFEGEAKALRRMQVE